MISSYFFSFRFESRGVGFWLRVSSEGLGLGFTTGGGSGAILGSFLKMLGGFFFLNTTGGCFFSKGFHFLMTGGGHLYLEIEGRVRGKEMRLNFVFS